MKYNSINEIITSPEWKEFIDNENRENEERLANMSLRERMKEALDNMIGPQEGVMNMIAGKSANQSSMIQKFLNKYQKDV